MAVNLHGVIRMTDDLALLVFTTESDELVLESLRQAGFFPRYSDTLEFALGSRVLLVRHTASGAQVDVMLGRMPFEQECVENRFVKEWDGLQVRVISVEALCIMKLMAARNQDQQDVSLLLETYPNLDRHWILEHVQQFGGLTEQPELVGIARQLLKLD